MLVSIIYYRPKFAIPVTLMAVQNESTFGSPTVAGSGLFPAAVVNASQFGTPVVRVAKRFLYPARVTNTSVINAKELNVTGKLNLLRVTNTSVVHEATLVITKRYLRQTGVINAATFGAPVVGAAVNPSYANAGGTGDRTALIFVTAKDLEFPSGAGIWDNLIDGGFGGNSTDSLWNSNDSGHIIYFDMRGVDSNAKQVINEFKWYQDTASSVGTYDLHGWDGNGWTLLKTGFTLGGATPFETVTVTNTAGFYVYRLTQTGGTWSSSPWCQEIEFKIDSGAAMGATTSYANTGGAGDRQSLITVTTDITLASGTIAKLVDGSNGTSDLAFNGSQSGKYIKFDFGSGHSAIIDSFTWYQGNTSSHGHWIFQGSNDDSTWDDLGTPFTLTGNISFGALEYTNPAGNVTAYRYYRLLQLYGSTSGSPSEAEIEFKIRNYA